jgi:transposase-like protein
MDIDMTKRRNFSAQFKATVARKTLRGDKTVQEISVKRHLHPTQVSTWKRQAMEGMASLFSDKANQAEIMGDEIKELHARTMQLAVANDFCHKG